MRQMWRLNLVLKAEDMWADAVDCMGRKTFRRKFDGT